MKRVMYSLRRLHGFLHENKTGRKRVSKLIRIIRTIDRTTVLYVLTPTHGNLGDHAITSAVISFLNSLNVDYVEITTYELTLLKKYNKLKCINGHPIIVNGGGNIGTLWPMVEEIFRAIIKSCPNSKILCLPNSAYFENSPMGREEYEKSKKIYNSHAALKICAREETSFELLRKIHQDVCLIPDMAMILNKCVAEQKRSGCLLCLRTDRERTRTDDEESIIFSQVKSIFETDVFQCDMFIGKSIPIEHREQELENKFNEFRSAELVITDRLHGMIFAAITGTLCIVIDSKSPKVRGCYEWLKELEYIQFCDSVLKIAETYAKMPKHVNEYKISHLKKYYEELEGYIMELIKE